MEGPPAGAAGVPPEPTPVAPEGASVPPEPAPVAGASVSPEPAPGDVSPAGPEAPPSLFAAVRLRGLFGWTLLALALTFVGLAVMRVHEHASIRRYLFPVMMVPGYLVPLAWTAHTFRRLGLSWRRLIGPPPPGGPLIGAMAMVLAQITLSASSFFLLVYGLSSLAPAAMKTLLEHPERFGPNFGGASPTTILVGTVVIAPVAEELLFRGLLYHRFAARWGPRGGLVATSLLFGALHMNVPAIFVFGLLLGVVYLRTRSLAACIVVHAFNNLIPALLTGLAAPAPDGVPHGLSVATVRAQAPFATLVTAVMAAVLLSYISNRWPRRGDPMPYDANGAPSPLPPDPLGAPIS